MFESTSVTQWIFIFLLVFGGLIAGWVLKQQERQLAASVAFGHFYGAAASVALIIGMMQEDPESGITILVVYPLFTTIGMLVNGILYKTNHSKKPTER